MTHILEMFELDVPRCTKVYGVTCSAELGVTGDSKCFNYPETCQVPEDFAAETQTLKWVTNSDHVPDDIGAIPSIESISTMPQRIAPGENLGRRERATISFKNHAHDDFIYDPYLADRDYNPMERGTHWGKFQARMPNIAGYPARIKRDFAYIPGNEPNWTTFHYIADQSKPAGDNAGFEIEVLDILTFVDGSKVLFPLPSNGVLATGMDDSSLGAWDLEPVGIGAEYPVSGEASIGKEIVSYTRSGDTVTITARAIRGTEAKSHSAGDTFQVAPFVSGNYAAILTTLLDATDTPATYKDSAVWGDEAAAYAPGVLGASIPTPTPVRTLINDLMADVGLDVHTDIATQKIIAKILRAKTQTFTMDYELPSRISGDTDYSRRVTAVYMQYGRLNPLEKMDQDSNYVGKLMRVDDDPIAQLRNNSASIMPHRSRWIPQNLRQVADQTSALLIGRYNRVSREITQAVPTEYAPMLGEVGQVSTRNFEDATGVYASIQMQVVQRRDADGMSQLVLEEFKANTIEYDGVREVSIPADLQKQNLWDLYVATWGAGEIPEDTTIVFQGNGQSVDSAKLGNTTVDGDWPTLPTGVTIEMRDLLVLGAGGRGGKSTSPNGQPGTTALYTRTPLTLRRCTLGGGGGGGGAADYSAASTGPAWSNAAGGAGFPAGLGDPAGSTLEGGTNQAGGGGNGGDIGQSGAPGSEGPGVFYPGGAAGVAIDGVSYITKIDCTIYGAEVN